jgi:transcriptional regulator with XRE-family HTH domain
VTQGELAVRAGTSQAAISQIERGEVEPSYDRLARLVYLTGHELRSSVVPAALLVDGDLLADSFALFAEQRVSAAIALSRRAQAARAAGQAEQEAMRESEAAQLRELAGL